MPQLFESAISKNLDQKALKKILKERHQALKDPRYHRYTTAYKAIKKLRKKFPGDFTLNTKNHTVTITSPDPTDNKLTHELRQHFNSMIPWRKGPFDICGVTIDAEWRSDYKWQRIRKALGSLQGKSILDIGCNNGYYLYLISQQKPKFLLGIDPVIPYYLQFQAIKTWYAPHNTDFELLGIQDLSHFDKAFDTVLCMGILYHHPDPIGILRNIWKALRPGGTLIVESQGIDHPGPSCLMPKNRYLGMPGHWFLPSKEALENMIRRSGFQYVTCFDEICLQSDEQRKTELAPYQTLSDGLDPKNPKLTIEGYPAPWRFSFKATKARKRR